MLMSHHLSKVLGRVDEYLKLRKLESQGQLGWGWDGVVIESNAATAVKGFKFIEQYERERDVYFRLLDNWITG